MTQYNNVNVKLSDSQLNILKSGIKNDTEVTLNLSSNIIGDSNDETNFPHKLLTYRDVSRFHKAFSNNSSANIKLSKTQLSKIVQSGGSLGKLLSPLMRVGLPLMKNGFTPIGRTVLIQLGLTAAAATDAAIQKKIYGSGMTTLIISKERMKDIMKIVKPPEESSLLIRSVSETTENEAKDQNRGFLSMLLGRLGLSLLRNLLGVNSYLSRYRTIRAGQDFSCQLIV